MTPPLRCVLGLVWLLALAPASLAALTITVGTHQVPEGANIIQVPVSIAGGDPVTDMVGVVQVGDGGPLVGGSNGPTITAVSYAGSVWAAAPGGFANSATVTLPAQIYDPNVSLKVAGQKVSGSGLLFTLTFDVAGFNPGRFELKLAGTRGGDTSFQCSGTNVPVTINNGWLLVGTNAPVIPVAPRLAIIPAGAGRVRLSFLTETGCVYNVQWRTDLAPGPWAEITNGISGTGGQAIWLDDGSDTGQLPGLAGRRFYRIRAQGAK